MTRPATLRPLHFYTSLDAYRAREGSELARAGAPTDRADTRASQRRAELARAGALAKADRGYVAP